MCFRSKGRLVHGPYKKEIRERWLERLLEVQRQINEEGPEEFRDLELITEAELNKIRQIWLEEKHEFQDTLPGIYKKVMGRDLRLDYHFRSTYGREEWELLEQLCQEECPEETLASSYPTV